MSILLIDSEDFSKNVSLPLPRSNIQNEFISRNRSITGGQITTKLLIIPAKDYTIPLVLIDNSQLAFLEARNGEEVVVDFNVSGHSFSGTYNLEIPQNITARIEDTRNFSINLYYV